MRNHRLFPGLLLSVFAGSTLLLACSFLSGCSTPNSGVFKRSTPHESYSKRLRDAGLSSTTLGMSWTRAAEKGQISPVDTVLPFREKGYFDKAAPASNGYRFRGRKGQVINITVSKNP